MGKAKEGIGSKGFMKRNKKGGFWTMQVEHATLEQRADLVLSRPKLRTQLSKHAYATFSPEAFEEHSRQSCLPDFGKIVTRSIMAEIVVPLNPRVNPALKPDHYGWKSTRGTVSNRQGTVKSPLQNPHP
ncbi:hypothetical protein PIB30_076554 [Stylosanthes scabra]|uniref:Uncharacterized protein n=1 Tax=Stylosanthes scabra TaxID=79078 RepID=A0ABU6WPZ8_9FABA|nr:hypothetical protein [Stylosanthes scabra]